MVSRKVIISCNLARAKRPYGEIFWNKRAKVIPHTADGKCLLEIFQTDNNKHTDDFSQIKFAAEVMFTRCVLNGGRQGAIAANLGKVPSRRRCPGADGHWEGHDERLGLIMRPYEPSVTCGLRFSKTMPILKWVETMFQAFPASRARTGFGPDILPWVMRTPGESQAFSTGSPSCRQLLMLSFAQLYLRDDARLRYECQAMARLRPRRGTIYTPL